MSLKGVLPMMKKTVAPIIYLSILIIAGSQIAAQAQTFLAGMDCSDEEFQITQSTPFIVIDDVGVLIRFPTREEFVCELTFTTEAATSSSSPQLMILQYEQLDINQQGGVIGGRGTSLFIEGPVISAVEDGFDRTHTFVNRARTAFLSDETDRIEIRPLLSSAFNRQYRIARHCLLVRCTAANQYSR
jgi:hypothetical protein